MSSTSRATARPSSPAIWSGAAFGQPMLKPSRVADDAGLASSRPQDTPAQQGAEIWSLDAGGAADSPALAPTESSHSTGAYALDGELAGDDELHDVQQPPFNDARIGQSAVSMVENSARLVNDDEPETAGRGGHEDEDTDATRFGSASNTGGTASMAPGSGFGGSSSDAPLPSTSRNLERLRRVPGVHGVLCIDEESGQPLHVQDFARGEAEARKTAGVLSDVLVRSRAVARALLDDDDQLLTVSIRTRLQLEYVLSPDARSQLAVAVLQDTAHAPNGRDEAHVAANLARSMMESSQSGEWLFGQADE